VQQAIVWTSVGVRASARVLTRAWARARSKHTRANNNNKSQKISTRHTQAKRNNTCTHAHKTRNQLTSTSNPNRKTSKNIKTTKSALTRAAQATQQQNKKKPETKTDN
jgi:hypothetical protein